MAMLVTVIWFIVNVPVLSEHRTLTDPRVSTVIKLLQSTLAFERVLAITAREMVTEAGNPSGIKATQTATTLTTSAELLMKPGWSFRSQVAQRMMMITAIVIAIETIISTNRRISF